VIDTVSRDGEHKVVAIWKYDKRDYHGSPVVYHGMQLLNVESNPDLHSRMVSYTTRVLDALGIRNGAIHSEIMATPRGPVLVEVNCRLHGGEGIWLPIAQECFGYTQVSVMVDAYLSPNSFAAVPPTPLHPMLKHGAWVTIRSPRSGVITEMNEAAINRIRGLPSYLDEYIAPFVVVGGHIVQTIDATTVHGCFNLAHADEAVLKADYDTAQLLINEGLFSIDCGNASSPINTNLSASLELMSVNGKPPERETRRAVRDIFGAEHLSRSPSTSPPSTSPTCSMTASPTLKFSGSPLLSSSPMVRGRLSSKDSLVLESAALASKSTEKTSFTVKIN